MCAKVVDLRETGKPEGEGTDKTPAKAILPPVLSYVPAPSGGKAASALFSDRAVPVRASEYEKDAIVWSAYERQKIARGGKWFLIPGAITLILTVLGVLIASYFFAAFVALAFVVFVMYAVRDPRRINFAVTSKGIYIDGKIHDFSDMKSFWIFDRPQFKELSFETSKVLYPYLRVPLEEVDLEKIKKALLKILPETEHPEFITDHISRRIGI